MNTEHLSKEQVVLITMRKVLASIARDTMTKPGMPHPLSEATIGEIRDCFGLISEREAELADAMGLNRNEKPFYSDQPQNTNVITMHKH